MSTLLTIIAIIVVFIILFKVFKLLLRILLVAVFLMIAWLTNPDKDDHEEAVVEKAEKTEADLKGKSIKVDDYLVFSLTYIEDVDDVNDDRLIGAGAFTQVWIFSKP